MEEAAAAEEGAKVAGRQGDEEGARAAAEKAVAAREAAEECADNANAHAREAEAGVASTKEARACVEAEVGRCDRGGNRCGPRALRAPGPSTAAIQQGW